MANSKTLLVYALALVVCAGSWAAANTVPVHSRDTFQARMANSPHYQKSQQPLPQSLQGVEGKLQQQYQPKSDELPASHVQQQQPGAAPTNNAPSSMTLKNGFGFSAGNSRNGPYTSGYGYLSGGRNLQSQPAPSSSQTPPSVYMTDYDLVEQSPRPNRLTDIEPFTPIPSAMSSLVPHLSDFTSILFGAMLGYAGHQVGFGDKFAGFFPGLRRLTRYFFGSSEPVVKNAEKKTSEKEKVEKISVKSEKEVEKTQTKNNNVEKSETATKGSEKAETENKEVSKVEHKEPAAATNSTENHRRRKRDVEVDTDLTQLATMVLTAIQSGECMQRSICLLGNQIATTTRGRTAFSLVDKLVPESVQGNQYFVTLKKALRAGDSFCDRFHCKLH